MENVTVRSHLRMIDWKENYEKNILDDSRENANVYRPLDCYIGHWDSDSDFTFCFHKEYESKALSIGTYFHGHIEPSDEGCLITGHFSKKRSVNIFFIFGGIFTMLVGLVGIYIGDYQTAIVGFALCAILALNYFVTPSRQKEKIIDKLEEISFTDDYHISKGKAKKYRKKK